MVPVTCRLCDPAEHVGKFHDVAEIHLRRIPRCVGFPTFEPAFPSGTGGREFIPEEATGPLREAQEKTTPPENPIDIETIGLSTTTILAFKTR
jgi:hypothetical protein